MGELGFWLMVTVLVIVFWGEPDLHDSIISYLNSVSE